MKTQAEIKTEQKSVFGHAFTVTLDGKEFKCRQLSVAESETWCSKTKGMWLALDNIGGAGAFQSIARDMAEANRTESAVSEHDIVSKHTTLGSWMAFLVEAIPHARRCVAAYDGLAIGDELEYAEPMEIMSAFFTMWGENSPLRPRRRTPAA